MELPITSCAVFRRQFANKANRQLIYGRALITGT